MSTICSAGKVPICNVYSATRAYIDAFSKCLHAEVKDKIDVMAIKCGGVLTNMSPVKDIFHVTPEVAVKSQLTHLGLDVMTHGYWRHCWHQRIFDTECCLLSWFKYGKMERVNAICKKTLSAKVIGDVSLT